MSPTPAKSVLQAERNSVLVDTAQADEFGRVAAQDPRGLLVGVDDQQRALAARVSASQPGCGTFGLLDGAASMIRPCLRYSTNASTSPSRRRSGGLSVPTPVVKRRASASS